MDYLKLFQNHTEYETFVSSGTMARPNVSHCVQENETHYNPWTDPRLIVKYNVANASELTKLYDYDGEVTATLLFDNVEIDGAEASIADLDAASGKTQLSVGEHTVKYTLKDPTSIVEYVFFNCSDLTSVTIPNSITSIGRDAFRGCDGLTSVHITDLAAWCNILFDTSTSNPLLYAYHLYLNGKEIKDLVIPNSVTSITQHAFSSCIGLISVTISNSVTSIGSHAFAYCSGLTSVNIGNSVTSIGTQSFFSCSGLTNIVSLGTTAPTIQNNTFQNIKTNGTLTVPSGSSGYDVWMGTGNYYLGLYNWTKIEQ